MSASPPQHSPSRLEEPDEITATHNAADYEAQVQQDLDAARAMSRGRASSTAGVHSPIASRPIGVPSAASTTTPLNASRPYGSSYLGGEVLQQQQQRGDLLSPNMGPSSPRRAFTVAASPAALRQQQHQAAIAAEAAAARFYQHHRRAGSNESVDSASHFIDHRNSQSGMTAYTPSPAAGRLMSANMPRSVGRATGRSPRANERALVEEQHQEQETNHSFRRTSHLSPSAISPSQLRHAAGVTSMSPPQQRDNMPGTPHTMSRRPSMLEDDVCFPMTTPHDDQHVGEHDLLEPSHHHPALHDDLDLINEHHDHHHHCAERLPPGYPFPFDLTALEDFAVEERARIEATSSAAIAAVSSWSGLRNRPSAIAARDVTGRSASATGTAATAQAYAVSPDSDDATFYSRRPRRFVPADAAAPEAGSGAAGSGRYQRKLALFEGGSATSPPPPAVSGRAATIAADEPPRSIMGQGALIAADVARARQAAGGAGADLQTPLLPTSTSATAPTYSAGNIPGSWEAATAEVKSPPLPRSQSMGVPLAARHRRKSAAASGFGTTNGGGANAHHPSLAEKPYRFTFYSNALPSTIHARHLAELPAPGQTFEELFSGFKPSDDATPAGAGTPGNGKDAAAGTPADGGSVAAAEDTAGLQGRPPMRQASALAAQLGRMEGNTAPPTGANTPELVSAPLGSASANGGGGAMSRGNTTARNSTAAVPPSAAAAQAAGRVIPGGGIRMDQDPEANTWWLDVLSPTDQEMKLLSRVFGIHPLTTEDILMEETREKIELFRNYYLACFRSFDQDPYSPTYLEPLNMYIIVFREGTLSFHFRATPHPQNVRRRIKQLKDYINVTSDWISYALIDDITDAFGPLIQSIEYEVDSIDELVLILKEAEQSDMLRRIGTCRKKVMGLLRLMGNKADVVKGLAKRCNENWSVAPKSDIGLYLSDIQDHLITMTQNLNHYEKILSRSHSNYLAQISIEMTDANNQINDVLSKLTALGTVIVPMNVITGLWGMNVHVPGQDVENLNWFAGIVSFMVALAVVGYLATIRYLSR